MIIADDLQGCQRELQVDGKRGWVVALPMQAPFTWRLSDAWAVLRGKAHAVREMAADDVRQRYLKKVSDAH